jgi:hypothetical protein
MIRRALLLVAVLSTNQTYGQTAAFQNAGTYPYHCAVHPDMTGKVQPTPRSSIRREAGRTPSGRAPVS